MNVIEAKEKLAEAKRQVDMSVCQAYEKLKAVNPDKPVTRICEAVGVACDMSGGGVLQIVTRYGLYTPKKKRKSAKGATQGRRGMD